MDPPLHTQVVDVGPDPNLVLNILWRKLRSVEIVAPSPPDCDSPVVAGEGHRGSVRRESDRVDDAGIVGKREQFLTRHGIPEPHAACFAGGGQNAAVGCEGKVAQHSLLITDESALGARFGVD